MYRRGYGITFATDADAQKVARAFRHLKTLCVKDNDMFSKVPAEEKKPKLSREETIVYIKKKLEEYVAQNDRPNVTYDNIISFDGAKIKYIWKMKQSTSEMTYTYDFNINAISSINTNDDPTFLIIDITPDSGLLNFFLRGTYWSDRANMPLWEDKQNETKKISTVALRIPGADPQDGKRLKKAFERLKELNKDEADPFDD